MCLLTPQWYRHYIVCDSSSLKSGLQKYSPPLKWFVWIKLTCCSLCFYCSPIKGDIWQHSLSVCWDPFLLVLHTVCVYPFFLVDFLQVVLVGWMMLVNRFSNRQILEQDFTQETVDLFAVQYTSLLSNQSSVAFSLCLEDHCTAERWCFTQV